MKKIIILMLICLSLSGCRKINNNTNDTTTTSETVAVYNAINKNGITHMNTYLYYDDAFKQGKSLSANEALVIFAESDKCYIVYHGKEKGYVLKNHVLITEDKTSESKDSVVVNQENVVVKTETKIITENNIPEGYEDYISKLEQEINSSENDNNVLSIPSTAAAPTTLFTTARVNDSTASKNVLDSMNKARADMGFPTFTKDAALQKQAEYYCEKFIDENSIKQISGYSVQTAGRHSGNSLKADAGESIVNRVSSFKDKNISKIGIAVMKDDSGRYIYYVILAK